MFLLLLTQYEKRYLVQCQPFGQVPTYEQDGLVLFESGAIVLHIADRYGTLLPEDPAARARAIEWMFAALNTLDAFLGRVLTSKGQ